MGLLKKYVTGIMAFFTPCDSLSHIVNFTLTLPLCYSLNVTKKLQNERKEDFFVYGCSSLSRYITGGKKSHLETNQNFQTHMLYKQPTLTNGGITIFLCKYFIVISDKLVGSFLDVPFLLIAVILKGPHEKPRRNKD